MTSLGLTAGSFGILEVEGSDQRFVVSGDGLVVLFEALNVTGDSVFGHAFGLGERSPVGHASGQYRHNGCEAPLWFGPEHDIEVAT
jgi:hypothetical protein